MRPSTAAAAFAGSYGLLRPFPDHLMLPAHLGHVNWFPGHMAAGMRNITERSRRFDVVLEVRDARLPHSTANGRLKAAINESKPKPHILLLNKADLVDPPSVERHLKLLASRADAVLSSSKESLTGVRAVIKALIDIAKAKQSHTTLLVCGLPNVGKSTIINLLRRSVGLTNAAQKGSIPGITRAVSHKVCLVRSPLIYVLDTPGIIDPTLRTPEQSLNLALANLIPDRISDIQNMAEFLFAQCRRLQYLDMVPNPVAKMPECPAELAEILLKEPKATLEPKPTVLNAGFLASRRITVESEDVCDGYYAFNYFIRTLAKKKNMFYHSGEPDVHTASHYFVEQYRKGRLGRFCLDDISIKQFH